MAANELSLAYWLFLAGTIKKVINTAPYVGP